MSAPSSPAKSPGEDFVLWPESVGTGVSRVNEAVIRRSLEGLAPTEWVADAEEAVAVEPAPPPPPVPPTRENRFYPASRQWFRSTAAIPAADATEKWWNDPLAEPAAGATEAASFETVSAPLGEGASTELLSPEEIWELAAEELEQASRLGAPAIPVASPPASDPIAAAPVANPVAEPEPLVVEDAMARAAIGVVPGVAARPQAEPLPAFPGTGPTVEAGPDEWDASEQGATATVDAVAASVPAPELAAPPAAAAGSPFELASPEPLLAIPVEARPAISLRTDPAGTPLPSQRRTARSTGPAEPMFDDLGLGGEFAAPSVAAPASVSGEPSMPAVAREGGEKRRRKRVTRRRTADTDSPRRHWGRGVLIAVGVLAVLSAAVGVMGRDYLPTDWEATVTRWYRKVHYLLFPHQYGYPRRGVQPRSGSAAENPGPAAVSPGTVGEPTSPTVTDDSTAATPPAASTPAASAALEVSPSQTPAPPVSDPAPAPGSTVDSVTPPPEAPTLPPGETVVPRAEPVLEDGEFEEPPPSDPETAPESTKILGSPAAAAGATAGSNELENGGGAASPAPEVAAASVEPVSPVPEVAAAPEPAPDEAASGTSFNLWEGDVPAAGSESPPAVVRAEPKGPVAVDVAAGEKAVRSVIAARSVADLLPWIFDASTLEPMVRAYYAKNPLQPLTDAVVEHEHSGIIPSTGGKAHLFNVLSASHPRGFPVAAETTPAGYRIDWQSYIQWRDQWLQRFLDEKPAEPQTLFVYLRRTHYFNDDVPQLDEKLAFKVTSAVPGDEGTVVFVEKNSAVGRSLAEMYEWRTFYFPVVELQWVFTNKQARFVRLNRIVRPTWRRLGD